jgi:hypothetical protein
MLHYICKSQTKMTSEQNLPNLDQATGQPELSNLRLNPSLGSLAVSGRTEAHEFAAEKLEHGFIRLENGRYFLPVVGGFETDIPTGEFHEEPSEYHGPTISLPATAIDTLPLGTYTMATTDTAGWVPRNTVTIHEYMYGEGKQGRYITNVAAHEPPEANAVLLRAAASIKSSPRNRMAPRLVGNSPGAFVDAMSGVSSVDEVSVPLFKLVGYPTRVDQHGKERVAGVISPDTLQDLTTHRGINIAFIHEQDQEGYAPFEQILGAYGDPKKPAYPVGIGNHDYNRHDSQDDDHIAGIFAAGQSMLNKLQPRAAKALADHTFVNQQLETGQRPDRTGLIEVGATFDDITFKTRKAYQAFARDDDEAIVETLAEVEGTYASMNALTGFTHIPGEYTAVILEGFIETGVELGWSEQKLAKMRQLMPVLPTETKLAGHMLEDRLDI